MPYTICEIADADPVPLWFDHLEKIIDVDELWSILNRSYMRL